MEAVLVLISKVNVTLTSLSESCNNHLIRRINNPMLLLKKFTLILLPMKTIIPIWPLNTLSHNMPVNKLSIALPIMIMIVKVTVMNIIFGIILMPNKWESISIIPRFLLSFANFSTFVPNYIKPTKSIKIMFSRKCKSSQTCARNK